MRNNITSPTSKYKIYTRKNLKDSSWYKDGDIVTHIKDVNNYKYITDWIISDGEKDNVYFIEGIASKCNEKYAFNENNGWHKTSYRTSVDPNKNGELNVRAKGSNANYLHSKIEKGPLNAKNRL